MSALCGTRAHTGRVEGVANDDKHLRDSCPGFMERGRKQVEAWTSTTTGSTAGSSRHEQDDTHDLGNDQEGRLSIAPPHTTHEATTS